MGKKTPRLVANPVAEKAHCLHSAQQFLNASARCSEEGVSDAGFIRPLIVPAVVNSAFAVELALKAMLLRSLKANDPAPEGHDLDVLFKLLAPADQAALRMAVPVPMYPKPKTPSADPFADALLAHSKAFVRWRYAHETGANLAASLPFLSELAREAMVLAG